MSNAVEERESVHTKWVITWDGKSYTEDDLTGADLVALAAILGDNWQACSPWVGPIHLVTFIAVLSAKATKEDYKSAQTRVLSASASQIAKAIRTLDED